MPKQTYEEIYSYIAEKVMKPFYEIRLERLNDLNLNTILKRKNPYLFKAKNIETSGEFIKYILDAYLSSQEETMFGNLLEQLAIFICEKTFNGRKATQGILKSVDLEFERDNKYYIVGIKSGIYWGNKDQIDRMKSNFKIAKKLLKKNGIEKEIVAVNGCIYGKDNKPFKEDSDKEQSYYKICGQEFWELISGDNTLYKQIILPLDKEAKKRSDHFKEAYATKSNEMTKDFSDNFLTKKGAIDWEKIVDFVSKK
ncbi:MAG: PmeII family type II restriction endonuclease [Minisyncoccota bacterium]